MPSTPEPPRPGVTVPRFDDPGSWRRVFPPRIPPERLVATASLGAGDPAWQELRAASYWDRLALLQLSHEPELRALMRRVGVDDGPRVLEIGCGPGVLARLLLLEGAAGVEGIERVADAGPLWDALPAPGSGARLSWRACRLSGPYPYPDDSFDLIWLSGYWFPRALAELRRILRPHGRIVATASGLVPYVSYAWDPGLEARLHAAYRLGYDLMHPQAAVLLRERTLYGHLRNAARSGRFAVWTVTVERWSPIPAVTADYLQQNFALFIGGLLKEYASPRDWHELTCLYDPTDPRWMFTRADLHILQTMLVAELRPGEPLQKPGSRPHTSVRG